jgi:hypothetical protein
VAIRQPSAAKLEKAVGHIGAALSLLQNGTPKSVRHAEWFRESGHLSELGITHLYSLFASGKSTYAAAKEMGISYRAEALRRRRKPADFSL